MDLKTMIDNINTHEPKATRTGDLMACVTRIAAAYVAHQHTTLEELPTIIARIYQTLSSVNDKTAVMTHNPLRAPAVPIEESVHDDYLVCLEDGKQLQMLKRHLSTMYGMTLDQYKARWNLPHDYPTVSASYARRRSAIAHTIGLGKNGRGKAKIKKAA